MCVCVYHFGDSRFLVVVDIANILLNLAACALLLKWIPQQPIDNLFAPSGFQLSKNKDKNEDGRDERERGGRGGWEGEKTRYDAANVGGV